MNIGIFDGYTPSTVVSVSQHLLDKASLSCHDPELQSFSIALESMTLGF